MKKVQRAGDLMTAIALLPEDHYARFCKEPIGEDDCDEDDDEGVTWLHTAYVFQQAPEDGWPSRGARFGHPPDSPSHQQPCEPHQEHDDLVLFGINAYPDKPEVVERLLIAAIQERWGKKKVA
jgi:hypothetical protein